MELPDWTVPQGHQQTANSYSPLAASREGINFRILVFWESKDLNFWTLPELSRVPQTMVHFQKTKEGLIWPGLTPDGTRSVRQDPHWDTSQEATNHASKAENAAELLVGSKRQGTHWDQCPRGTGTRELGSLEPSWICPALFASSPSHPLASLPSFTIFGVVHLGICF